MTRRQVAPFRPQAFRDSRLGAPSVTQLAAVVPGLGPAVSGAGAIISEVESLVNFGDSHKYGAPNFTGAEKARADAALLGIAAGSVLAGQYLLGQNKSDTSVFAQQYTTQILTQARGAYPSVMQQAENEGAVFDQADGTGVLTILLNNKIPFSGQYVGYSTNTGTLTASALASQLAALPALPPSSTVGSMAAALTGVVPASSSGGLTTLAVVGGGLWALSRFL